MKRTMAMLLALLMLLFSFALSFGVLAEDDLPPVPEIGKDDVELSGDKIYCEFCGQLHNSYNAETGTIGLHSCTCCLECDYLDGTALTKCARNAEGHYIGSREKMCCSDCTGFFPCLCKEVNDKCTCVYCGKKSQVNEQEPVDVVPEKAKSVFSSVLTTVVNKLSEVFGKLFELLFGIFGVEE